MNATYIDETRTVSIGRANIDGGDYTLEVIDGDMVCSDCGCYVSEVDLDAYHCKKCDVIIYS